jgi:hypothetical protein
VLSAEAASVATPAHAELANNPAARMAKAVVCMCHFRLRCGRPKPSENPFVPRYNVRLIRLLRLHVKLLFAAGSSHLKSKMASDVNAIRQGQNSPRRRHSRAKRLDCRRNHRDPAASAQQETRAHPHRDRRVRYRQLGVCGMLTTNDRKQKS